MNSQVQEKKGQPSDAGAEYATEKRESKSYFASFFGARQSVGSRDLCMYRNRLDDVIHKVPIRSERTVSELRCKSMTAAAFLLSPPEG